MATEAAITDMRKELAHLQEQLDVNKAFILSEISSCRKELLEQLRSEAEEVRKMVARTDLDVTALVKGREDEKVKVLDERVERRLEMLEERSREVALQNTQRVTPLVPAPAPTSEVAAVRSALEETRLIIDEVRRDLGYVQKNYVDLTAKVEVLSLDGPLTGLLEGLTKQVSETERRLSESVTGKMKVMDVSLQSSQLSIQELLKKNVERLEQELRSSSKEHHSVVSDISIRTEELERRLGHQEEALSGLAKSRDTVAPSDSASQVNSSGKTLGGLMGTTDEHMAVASCIGALDAELRNELDARLKQLVIDLKSEIAAVEARIQDELRSLHLPRLEQRLQRLDDARLDLRIGALETAAQRAAAFAPSLTGGQMESGDPGVVFARAAPVSLARGPSGHMEEAGTPATQSVYESPVAFTHESSQATDPGTSISQGRALFQDLPGEEAAPGIRPLSLLPEESPAPFGLHLPYFRKENSQEFGGGASTNGSDTSRSMNPISDELRERLQDLVAHVKSTLKTADSQAPNRTNRSSISSGARVEAPSYVGPPQGLPGLRPVALDPLVVAGELRLDGGYPQRPLSPGRPSAPPQAIFSSAQVVHSYVGEAVRGRPTFGPVELDGPVTSYTVVTRPDGRRTMSPVRVLRPRSPSPLRPAPFPVSMPMAGVPLGMPPIQPQLPQVVLPGQGPFPFGPPM